MTDLQSCTDDAYTALLEAEASQPTSARRAIGVGMLALGVVSVTISGLMIISAVLLGTPLPWVVAVSLMVLGVTLFSWEIFTRRRAVNRHREAYQVFRYAVSREIRVHGMRVLRRNPAEHWFETTQGRLQVDRSPDGTEVIFTVDGMAMDRFLAPAAPYRPQKKVAEAAGEPLSA